MNEFEPVEVKTESVQALVTRALQDVPKIEELEAMKDRQDKLTLDLLHGDITKAEYEAAWVEDEKGVVKLNTPEDLKAALNIIGLPDDVIDELVSHELDHFKKAVELGVKGNFLIQLFEDIDGVLGLYPSIHLTFPDGMTEKEMQNILKAVIEAPEDLSSRDLSQLGK